MSLKEIVLDITLEDIRIHMLQDVYPSLTALAGSMAKAKELLGILCVTVLIRRSVSNHCFDQELLRMLGDLIKAGGQVEFHALAEVLVDEDVCSHTGTVVIIPINTPVVLEDNDVDV